MPVNAFPGLSEVQLKSLVRDTQDADATGRAAQEFKRLREMGVTAAFLGADGWDSADLDREALAGGYHTNHYSPDDPRPVVAEWVSKYEAEFGEVPDALATLAYDAANMLFQGMEAAGSADPAAVAEAMEGLTYDVVSGQSYYDDQHNPVKPAAILQVTEEGSQFITIMSP